MSLVIHGNVFFDDRLHAILEVRGSDVLIAPWGQWTVLHSQALWVGWDEVEGARDECLACRCRPATKGGALCHECREAVED